MNKFKDLQIVEERNILQSFFLHSYCSINADECLICSLHIRFHYSVWPTIESQCIHIIRKYIILSVQFPVFRRKILYLRVSKRPRILCCVRDFFLGGWITPKNRSSNRIAIPFHPLISPSTCIRSYLKSPDAPYVLRFPPCSRLARASTPSKIANSRSNRLWFRVTETREAFLTG